MASFRAWAAVGPFDGTILSPLDSKSERDRLFLERASLSRRLPLTRSLHNLDDPEWRRSSVYADPVGRLAPETSVLVPGVVSPRREVSTTVTNSRGDVLNTHTTRDTYGDTVTTRRLADHYSTKTSVAHDPCAGDKVWSISSSGDRSKKTVSLVLSPNHRDDFMLDQLRTKTYIDRLDGTDTRSLYLDDPLCSRSSRYLDDPYWRRSRYLDDPLWSSPSRILNNDLWRHPSTNKSSALNDRQFRRAMRALV